MGMMRCGMHVTSFRRDMQYISLCGLIYRVQTTCETKAPFVKLLYVLRQFGADVGQIHSCVECSIMKF